MRRRIRRLLRRIARHLRSEEHTSELQSRLHLVCRLLLEKKKPARGPSCPAGRCSGGDASPRDAGSREPADFFFNDTATTEIYTLSLHDALPIWLDIVVGQPVSGVHREAARARVGRRACQAAEDRKSTRLNSSHGYISYAVF